MSPTFSELLKASILNLRNFLETEVDLGITFAQIAEAQRRKGNAERYEVSKQNAITALEAIDRVIAGNSRLGTRPARSLHHRHRRRWSQDANPVGRLERNDSRHPTGARAGRECR